VWEVAAPPSRVCATGWDAGALVRLTPEAARPDITMHFPVEAWVDHVVAYGVEMPPYCMAIAMAAQLRREVFPGPQAVSDADISAPARATHQTVYHVSGTCRMGAEDDPLAVLDPELRVRGVAGLRVADASVFPTIPSVNPVVTVMITAERAAALIRQDSHPSTPR
jgi:choline dehydrogenase-like flavoprotein